MQTRAEVIGFCLTFPGAYEDEPFHDDNWTVMRRADNRRGFAFILEREGCLWVNVKCDPDWADVYRSQYPAVRPAYHMNKRHWNSLVLDGSLPEDVITFMLTESFELCGRS